VSDRVRVSVLGAPVARPLDFAEAFAAMDPDSELMEEESGAFRSFVVVGTLPGGGPRVRLSACVAPRNGIAEAFAQELRDCEVAIWLACAAGASEQEAAERAFFAAVEETGVPSFGVTNDFVPPRLADSDELPAITPLSIMSGRLCWWRHEKSGAELVLRALQAAVQIALAVRERERSEGA
jgi:hypothetical protein